MSFPINVVIRDTIHSDTIRNTLIKSTRIFGGVLGLPNDILVTISLTVDTVESVQACSYGGHAIGAILPIVKHGRASAFVVQIHGNLPKPMLLHVLAHELAHVDQYVTGRLADVNGEFQWDGKVFPADTPYTERPWEHEAERVAHAMQPYVEVMSAV